MDNLLVGELSTLCILRGDVATCLANLRQHLTGHPTLESLGLWQLRRENQRVETTFVDEHRFLVSADGVTNRYAIRFVLIIYMIKQCFTAIAVPQCRESGDWSLFHYSAFSSSSFNSLNFSSEMFSKRYCLISSSDGSWRRYLLTKRFCERPSVAYCTVVTP